MEYKKLKFEECREGITNIRRKVFVEEQSCPESMEWDENEEVDSLYFVAFRGELAVGCLRLRTVEQDVLKMERVAVLKEFRRRGIAKELIREAMLHTHTELPNSVIYAYAQVSAIQAYIAQGFTIISKVWIEDGTFIPHQTIFWGTAASVEIFLKHQAEKSDVSYEEYDARHPSNLPKIQAFKERIENLEAYNICSLHLLLDDKVISKTLRKRFAKFCEYVELFLSDELEEKSTMVQAGDFLLKMADRKLNIGHFSEVDENWRVLYALVCFVQSFALFKREKYQDAVTIADKGLCMGRIDEDKVPLRQLASLIHEYLPSTSADSTHASFCAPSEHVDRLNALPNSVPVEECDDDGDDSFERLLSAVRSERPLLVRGLAANMPAVEKWTFPYLLDQLHTRTFPVEIGTKYSDEDWSQKMMTFGEFIRNSENQQLYLAQHRLFDQVPHLKRDVIIPDVCFSNSDNEENVDLNMWIGPSGTVSPLHTDPRKNMFVQVLGTKLFRLVAPKDSASVYPFDGMLSNTSQVDVENPDLAEYPEFSKCQVLDAIVNSGDALFIPEKWWHFVRSTTPSISVSFWFD